MQIKESSALTLIRIALGVFFLCESYQKLGWLMDSAELHGRLTQWAAAASSANRWYVENVAIPGAPIFARVVMLGELCAGFALVFGVWTRLAATLAFLMVMNFHYASGQLFGGLRFLTNGYALPVLVPLVALALAGGRLPLSLKK